MQLNKRVCLPALSSFLFFTEKLKKMVNWKQASNEYKEFFMGVAKKDLLRNPSILFCFVFTTQPKT